MFTLSKLLRNNAGNSSINCYQNVPKVFDTHCHLGVRTSMNDKDLFPVFNRAAVSSNVKGMAVIGIDLETSRVAKRTVDKLIEYNNKNNNMMKTDDSVAAAAAAEHIGYSIGLHPHSAMKYREEFPAMKEMILAEVENKNSDKNSKLLFAIGETGLDYFKSQSSERDQKDSLLLHFELASETNLPVIIHCRNISRQDRRCHEELFDMIEDFNNEKKRQNKNPVRGVIHCFSDNVRSIERILDIGTFYASFCCTLGYRTSYDLRAACEACPLEKMVIETDAPYLPPADRRGTKNEPMHVQSALDYVLDCKIKSMVASSNEFLGASRNEIKEEVAKKLWKNSLDLFGI